MRLKTTVAFALTAIVVGAAAPVAGAANPLSGIEGIGQALGSGIGLAAKAGTWLSNPQNWVRVIYVQVGAMLLIGALVILVAPTVIGLASPAGKAGKAAKAVRSVAT